jgi:hypothetical protein
MWNFVTEVLSINLQVGFGKRENSWSWSVFSVKAPQTMHKVSWTGMCMHLLILFSTFFVLLIEVDIDYNVDLAYTALFQKLWFVSAFLISWYFLNNFVNQQERDNYEYIVCEGKLINNQSGDFLHTKNDSENAKWIFVMSTSKKLYAGKVITIQVMSLFLVFNFLVQSSPIIDTL